MASCAESSIRFVLDAAPVCASVWSREGHSVDCNDAALRFFGLASKQVWLDHHAELWPECQPGGEASSPLFLAHLRTAFAEGRAEFDWEHRRLDGRVIPAQITLARFGQDGNEQVLAYAVQQSDTLAADAAPDIDELRMRLMFDSAPLGCTLWNARGEVVDCNAEILSWLGLDSKQAFRERVAEFWPELQADGRRSEDVLKRAMDHVLQTGGRLTIPWMQKVRGGGLVPCEGTVLRVMQGDEPMVAVFIRDVREQARLEAENRLVEERARLMLDASPLACTISNLQGQMVDCNLEALKLFGVSSKQEYLARCAEFLPEYQPDSSRSLDVLSRNIAQALETGRFVRPTPWIRKNTAGESIPCELTVAPITQNGVPMVVAFLRDLREAMKLEAEKRRAEERTQLVLDAAPLACTIWNAEGEMIDCNLEALELVGLSSKQEYLERYAESTPEYQPDGSLSSEMPKRYAAQALQGGRFVVPTPWIRRHISGELIPCELIVAPLIQDGVPLVAAFLRDMREAMKLEAEKRKAEERTRLVLDAAPLACTVWNTQGQMIDCNLEALKLFGMSSKQEYLTRYAEFMPEYQPDGSLSVDMAKRNIMQGLHRGHFVLPTPWMRRHTSGELIPCELTVVRVMQDDAPMAVAFLRDLREEIKLAAEKRTAEERTRLMLDAAPLACTIWNARNELIDCNVEALSLFGLGSKQELIARFDKLVPEFQPDGGRSAELGRQHIAHALQAGHMTLSVPWMRRTTAGELIPCELNLVRVMHGEEPMVAAFYRDLRRERKLLAEKRAAEERMQIMLDATPMGCTLWDEQAKLLDCNQEAVRLFGLGSKRELLDRFFELSPPRQPDGQLSAELITRQNRQARDEGYVRFDWMHCKPDGEMLPASITLVRVKRSAGYVIAAYIRDLREEKKLQAAQREADERQRIMFDTTPACTTLWAWDEGRVNLIDCNQEAANLFEVGSRQAYIDHFAELSPEYQPCGRLSSDMAGEYVAAAFCEGRSRFEWMHQKLNGEPLPSEVTLRRAEYGGRVVVVGNTRDLREEKKLEAEKREADERARIMLDATPLGCTLWDEQSRLIDCNEAAVSLFGMGSKREFLDRFFELSPEHQPDGQLSAEVIARYIRQAYKEGYVRLEWTHCKPDGEMLPAEVTLVRVERAEGQAVAAYIRDLREIEEVLRRIHEANEYTQLMLDATPLSCNLFNEAHQMIACNQEAVNLFGLSSKEEYLGRYRELAPEYQPSGRKTRELTHEYLDTAFREGRARFDWMHQKLDGTPVPVEATLVRIAHDNGYIVASYKRDLRELKEGVASLKRLEALAYTDKLTRAANRHYFMEHATDQLGRLSPGGSASLFILDIDHFKHVNDTYGHTGGDVILQGVAERIRKSLRPDDLFARYGGEEFVILLGRASLDPALALAERVREVIAREPFEYQGQTIKVTISIGVAMSGHPATPLQDLIDQADAALYQAKHLGRNRVERFQSAEEIARAS
ncbi:PAS domain-containing protein [Niveibacterium sp. SC-1]|uniref:PAS domain S-box protein n=1 Tax=Niveibacterium sp. SC-1 TaxID=3135646 RepID=UPI00311E3406